MTVINLPLAGPVKCYSVIKNKIEDILNDFFFFILLDKRSQDLCKKLCSKAKSTSTDDWWTSLIKKQLKGDFYLRDRALFNHSVGVF